MPKIVFNAKKIENLKPGPRSVEYFEKGRKPGEGAFGIRVSPKGKMVWFVMYKNQAAKIKRYTIGEYPALSLKVARKQANDAMARVNKGEDPQAKKQARKNAPTMNDLWKAYQEALALRKKPKAASTVKEEERKWNRVIEPKLGSTKVEDVTPAMLADLLDKLAETSPVSANRLHSLLRVMFKPALRKGWITVHPMQWVDKPGGEEPPRKRVLDDNEIRTIWPFFDNLRSNPCDTLKLCLLTAQRSGEIMSMRWDDIDIDEAIWRQHDPKNEITHIVPLSPQVMDILSARKTTSKWVFPSNYNKAKGAKMGHARDTKSARNKVQEWSGITGWVTHDLRRTARTIMSRLKIKQHVRERVLNHKQKGVVGVYDQFDYLQEKRNALEKLSREIYRIIGQAGRAEVIKMNVVSMR